MKAKYSRVVGGFTIGLAVGGLLAAWLVRATGDIRQLLVLDLVPLAAFAALLALTGRRYPAQLHAIPAPVAEPVAVRATGSSSRDGGGQGRARPTLPASFHMDEGERTLTIDVPPGGRVHQRVDLRDDAP